jgi:hypothetical protein
MGNNSSKRNQEYLIEQQKLQEQALRNFNARVESYSYPYHRSYIEYIESCRQGPNYKPEEHDYY